jgi:hypothetical protein
MNKKHLIIALTILMVLASASVSNALSSIDININGANVPFSIDSGKPFIDAYSRTQVPLRVTMEQFGCTVNWNSLNKIANVEKDGVIVEVPIGEPFIIVNGKEVANDTIAQIKDGRTYLPIRSVLQAFGAEVKWDSTNKTVIVNSMFKFDAKTGTIEDCHDDNYQNTDLSIPKEINGVVVRNIGPYAFYNSTMKNLMIPSSVETIDTTNNGYKTFGFMLENIYVDKASNDFSDIGGVLFNKNKDVLIWYGEHRKASEYTVPAGTNTLRKNSFTRNSYLVTLNIPASVALIENGAITNCTKISRINVDANNQHYYSIDGILYEKNGNPVILPASWNYKNTTPLENISPVPDTNTKPTSETTTNTSSAYVQERIKQYERDLTNLQSQIEIAKNSKTVRLYTEGQGWIWTYDSNFVSSLEKQYQSKLDSYNLFKAMNDIK